MGKDFGKLTKKQAKQIGNFIDEDGIIFTPFCQEMTDGTYLILRESWDKYHNRAEFNGINEPQWLEYSQLVFKTPNIF